MRNEVDGKTAPATAATLHYVTSAAGDACERLDRVLAAHLGDLSRSRLKHLILEGSVTRDGATISDPAMRVKPGQIFQIAIPEAVLDHPLAQAMSLDILYEDDHLLVVDKPAGLVVHPAPGNPDRTLVNALLAHCGDSLVGIGGVKRPGIVHRLDKDTSGVMVVAKNDVTHQALSKLFAAHDLTRIYQALVWGGPKTPKGTIDAAIGRHPVDRKRMAVRQTSGRKARAGAQCKESEQGEKSEDSDGRPDDARDDVAEQELRGRNVARKAGEVGPRVGLMGVRPQEEEHGPNGKGPEAPASGPIQLSGQQRCLVRYARGTESF